MYSLNAKTAKIFFIIAFRLHIINCKEKFHTVFDLELLQNRPQRAYNSSTFIKE